MMNEIAHSFHIDPVVADQFFGHFSNPRPAGPEKELLIAVLADAFECYCKYSKSRKNSDVKLFQEARKWIFTDNDDAPLGFVNVCDALSLDPNYLRQRLLDQRSYGLTPDEKQRSRLFKNMKLGRKGKNRSAIKGSASRQRNFHTK